MILLLVDTLHQPTMHKYGDIHVCYKLNDFNLTSTDSALLRSPLDEVIEVAPPQGKLLFLTISAKPAYPWGTTNQRVSD